MTLLQSRVVAGRTLFRRGRSLAGRVKRGVLRRAAMFARRIPLPRLPERKEGGIPVTVIRAKRRELVGKRAFGRADLDRLAALLDSADEVVPIREAFARRDNWPERFLTIRHDMDHDLENSVRLAEWEADHGWRATYYVLHSDWYWGSQPGQPSPYVLRALDRIASLGHEIGVHNNAVATALIAGSDPVQVLDDALSALRRHGFDVTGTVAHGDRVCRAASFVNNEMFEEGARPAMGAPDRTITYDDPATGAHHELTLRPIPMAQLGLTYEANLIGHTLYLSDTGGRWNRPFGGVEDQFISEGGFLQILVHPVWWALSGEPVTARPTVAIPVVGDGARGAAVGDPSAPPFRIVVRGDCCSRRAIDFNRDLFGGNPQMVRDEKARTDFFVDHLTVGSASRQDIARVMDVDRMSNSLRHYALGQTDRSTLTVSDAQLLVFDNYSDMNFAAWRQREHGWKIWAHPGFIRDLGAFEDEFEKVGSLSFEESLELHAQLIEHYRAANGPVPVLYLHQPIAYYPKLGHRAEFRKLGPALEQIVPHLYSGDIEDDDLEPDDLGSCGPGKTLHFIGATYRRMILSALEKGLAEWLNARPTAIPS